MSENQSSKKYTVIELILVSIVLFFPLLFAQLIVVIMWIAVLAVLCGFLLIAVIGIGGLVAGVAMVGVGIEKIFTMPMGALAVMGFGFANIGVALLAECFVIWIYGVVIPTLIKKIVNRGNKNEEAS